MMAYHKCPICKEYPGMGEIAFGQAHRCPPKWLCRFDWDNDDEEATIYAYDPEKAAEKFVERYDAEYGSRHGISETSVVFVYGELTGVGVRVEVEGALVRTYCARMRDAIEIHPDYAEETA